MPSNFHTCLGRWQLHGAEPLPRSPAQQLQQRRVEAAQRGEGAGGPLLCGGRFTVLSERFFF